MFKADKHVLNNTWTFVGILTLTASFFGAATFGIATVGRLMKWAPVTINVILQTKIIDED